jgi:UDP-3-O-acyl-N-acetylglucosamine deacetylase
MLRFVTVQVTMILKSKLTAVVELGYDELVIKIVTAWVPISDGSTTDVGSKTWLV